MANDALWLPGTLNQLAGTVVFSKDAWFDDHPVDLVETRKAVRSLYKQVPTDPELASFAAEISTDSRRLLELMVPAKLAGGRRVHYEELPVDRRRLPTGFLSFPLLPVVVLADEPTSVEILPLEFWSPSWANKWRAAPRPSSPASSPPVFDAYLRHPVQLTARAAATIRSIAERNQLVGFHVRVTEENGAFGLDLQTDAINRSEDAVTESAGLRIVVARSCVPGLMAMIVDFKDAPKGFSFHRRAI